MHKTTKARHQCCIFVCLIASPSFVSLHPCQQLWSCLDLDSILCDHYPSSASQSIDGRGIEGGGAGAPPRLNIALKILNSRSGYFLLRNLASLL